MSHIFLSSKKLLELIKKDKGLKTISDVMIRAEMEITNHSEKEILQNAKKQIKIMKESIHEGLEVEKSKSGMVDNEAKLAKKMVCDKNMMLDSHVIKGISNALAVVSANALMKRIVAAPTAGSSGIVPGCLFAVQERFGLNEDVIARALLASAGIGVIVANKSTFSGAKAGCQAEIGVSAAMAAAAISEARGMDPERCINASALALKNLLGLACDPIAGLVEVPCVKRNAFGVTHAMTASDLSYAGITSIVPFDEVLMAMNNIAKNMTSSIRETSRGGLAVTPTGKQIAQKLIKLNYR